MQIAEVSFQKNQQWNRSRIVVWLFVFLIATLNVVFIASIDAFRSQYLEFLLAGFAGVVLGEFGVVSLLSGLTGRTWLGGYFRGLVVAMIGFLAIACSIWFVAAPHEAFLQLLSIGCAVPWVVLAASVPLMMLRQFGWRLEHRTSASLQPNPLGIADLLHGTAIVAATLTLARVPSVVMEADVGNFWPALSIISGGLFLFGLLVMPLAARIAFGSSSRFKSMIGLGLLAIAAYVISVIVPQFFMGQDVSWQSRGQVLLPMAVVVSATAAVLHTFMIVFSLSGVVLIRKRRGTFASNETNQGAEQPKAVSPRRARWQIAISIAIAAIVNFGLTRLEASRRARDLEIARLTAIAQSLGGTMNVYDRNVTFIQLGEKTTDADLEEFAGCRSLRSLDVTSGHITDKSLERISKFNSLASISIKNAAITDAGLVHLSNLGLVSLELTNCNITDAGLSHLAKLNGLSTLNLADTRITGAGLTQIADNIPIRELTLDRCAVSDAHCHEFARLKYLDSLSLNGTAITDKGLSQFVSALDLSSLHLKDTEVDGTGLQLNRSIQVLDLSNSRVTDESIQSLISLTELAWLSLSNTKITDKAIEHLVQIQKLAHLDLSRTQVSDAGVAKLAKIASPQWLDLSGTSITGQCFQNWPRSPQLTLVLSDTLVTDATLPLIARMVVDDLWLDGTKITAKGLLSAGVITGTLHVRQGQFTETDINRLESIPITVEILDPKAEM
jgi:Leucine-rich repeat (LRR) protein